MSHAHNRLRYHIRVLMTLEIPHTANYFYSAMIKVAHQSLEIRPGESPVQKFGSIGDECNSMQCQSFLINFPTHVGSRHIIDRARKLRERDRERPPPPKQMRGKERGFHM